MNRFNFLVQNLLYSHLSTKESNILWANVADINENAKRSYCVRDYVVLYAHGDKCRSCITKLNICTIINLKDYNGH